MTNLILHHLLFQIPNETLQQDNSNLISDEVDSDNQVKTKRKVLKISMLLLGPAESGKSTLLKQMKVSFKFLNPKCLYNNFLGSNTDD